MSEPTCGCLIPKHWPKHETWAHNPVCPWRVRAMALLKERVCG